MKKIFSFIVLALFTFALVSCDQVETQAVGFDLETLTLEVGETATLALNNPRGIALSELSFQSEDEAVVSVSSTGSVEAIGEGITAVTLTYAEVIVDFILVNVYDPDNVAVDGREVVMRVQNNYVQWAYEGDTSWNDLISLFALTGADGQNGTNGTNGLDGKEVEFNVSETHMQWRYVGDANWTDLLPLSLLQGTNGQDGLDGQDGVSITDVYFETQTGLQYPDLFNYGLITESDPNDALDPVIFNAGIGEPESFYTDQYDFYYDYESFYNTYDVIIDGYDYASYGTDFYISQTIDDDVYPFREFFSDSSFGSEDSELYFSFVIPEGSYPAITNQFQPIVTYTVKVRNFDNTIDTFTGSATFDERYYNFDGEGGYFDAFIARVDLATVHGLTSDQIYDIYYVEYTVTDDFQSSTTYLTFEFSEGPNIKLNFSEFLFESSQFQAVLDELDRLNSEIIDTQLALIEFAHSNFVSDLLHYTDLFAQIIALQSFVHLSDDYYYYGEESLYEALYLLGAYYYENSGDMSYFDAYDQLSASFVEYYYGDPFTESDYLNVLESFYYATGIYVESMTELEVTMNYLEHIDENSFIQYVFQNPLTDWDIYSISDRIEYVTLSAQNLLSIPITIELDPNNYGVELMYNYWKSGGYSGVLFDDEEGDWSHFQDWFVREVFTTDINPGVFRYDFNAETQTMTFNVNYGQVFPMPSDVSFDGLVLGANFNETDRNTGNPTLATTVADEGRNQLDYIIQGADGKYYRMGTYYFDQSSSYIPTDIVDGQNWVNPSNDYTDNGTAYVDGYANPNDPGYTKPNPATPAFADMPIGLAHANQLYYTYQDIENRLSYNQRSYSVNGVHQYYVSSFPEERQYITFDQNYTSAVSYSNLRDIYQSPFFDHENDRVVIKLDWIEVFKVEYKVGSDVVKTEWVDAGEDTTTAPNPEPSLGYKPSGDEPWTITGTGTWNGSNETIDNVRSNIVAVFNEVPIEYTVSFDTQGGDPITTVLDAVYDQDISITALPTPVREGYTFEGWYLDSEADSDEIFNTSRNLTTVDGDNVVLYAAWSLTPMYVTYNLGGVLNAVNGDNDEELYITDLAYTLEDASALGYDFIGWFDASTGGNLLTSISVFGDVTVYARFRAINYAVTVDIQGQGDATFEVSGRPNIAQTISLTLTPDSGFAVDTVTAYYVDVDGNEQALTVTPNAGKYEVTMPADDITFVVTLKVQEVFMLNLSVYDAFNAGVAAYTKTDALITDINAYVLSLTTDIVGGSYTTMEQYFNAGFTVDIICNDQDGITLTTGLSVNSLSLFNDRIAAVEQDLLNQNIVVNVYVYISA